MTPEYRRKWEAKNKAKRLRQQMVRRLASNDRGKYDNLMKWGREKSRDFMYNVGYEGYDKEVTAERNKQFVGNIILLRGTNEILQV